MYEQCHCLCKLYKAHHKEGNLLMIVVVVVVVVAKKIVEEVMKVCLNNVTVNNIVQSPW